MQVPERYPLVKRSNRQGHVGSEALPGFLVHVPPHCAHANAEARPINPDEDRGAVLRRRMGRQPRRQEPRFVPIWASTSVISAGIVRPPDDRGSPSALTRAKGAE